MRKTLVFALALLLLLSGCGTAAPAPTVTPPPLATETPAPTAEALLPELLRGFDWISAPKGMEEELRGSDISYVNQSGDRIDLQTQGSALITEDGRIEYHGAQYPYTRVKLAEGGVSTGVYLEVNGVWWRCTYTGSEAAEPKAETLAALFYDSAAVPEGFSQSQNRWCIGFTMPGEEGTSRGKYYVTVYQGESAPAYFDDYMITDFTPSITVTTEPDGGRWFQTESVDEGRGVYFYYSREGITVQLAATTFDERFIPEMYANMDNAKEICAALGA